MRIGIDLTAAITQGAGIGRYTRELVHALIAIDQQNAYRFFSAKPPVSPAAANAVPTAPNVVYRPAPLNERWLYRLWYRLRLPLPVQLVTGPIDLFHSPDFVLPPVNGRIPTLVTVHDLSFLHYPHTFPPRLVSYLNQVVPWSIGRATHVLADSEATRQDLITLWQVPAQKVTVLYCGVSPRFRPVTDEAAQTAVRAKYGVGMQPYLLSVGTVQPRKNYHLLIEAFAAVAADVPHNLIISGGKGWLYEDLLAAAARRGIEQRVRFIGYVDDDDLPALYSAADLFLFPSLYEGFGLPLLEAMACGAPVISSQASSLPEVVGKAAVLLPPRDPQPWTEAIRALLADEARRAALSAAGRRRAELFSWETAAAQLLGLYEALGSE